jgi:hypothetical protein
LTLIAGFSVNNIDGWKEPSTSLRTDFAVQEGYKIWFDGRQDFGYTAQMTGFFR